MKARSLPSIFAAIAVLVLGSIYYAYTSTVEESRCEMVWMYQGYARLNTFDTTHSRMANKYSIHLYREGGIDEDTIEGLYGVPVLFIPGHAGSYRQARSIASRTARRRDEDKSLPKFDVFTADFIEDFTAFHGRTMLDQAEFVNDAIKFILSLYEPGSNAPESVVVIGHSMGGIVARALFALPNYTEGSINTVLTLATPHTLPPLTFDHDIITVYDLVNQYWRQSFAKEDSENPLRDVTLISVVGGKRDGMVPSDYCSVSSVVPRSHGFTTFTTSIPDCWAEVDHLAMTWCGQMRHAVVEALFNMVDLRSPGRTLPVTQRVEAFANELLSGFEDYPYMSTKRANPDSVYLKSKHFIIHEQLQMAAVPEGVTMLELKNGTTLAAWTNSMQAQLLQCRDAVAGDESDRTEMNFASYESSTDYVCREMHALKLPLVLNPDEDPHGQGTMNFYSADYDGDEKFNYIALVSRHSHEAFFVARVYNSTDSIEVSGDSATKIPGSYFADLSVAPATVSLLAYSIEIEEPKDHKFAPFFMPVARAYTQDPFEAQFGVGLRSGVKAPLNLHANGPFMPYNPNKRNNMHIQVFTPPAAAAFEVKISLDWKRTVGNLAMRYRIVAATFPLAVAVLVFGIQLWNFNTTGSFTSFHDNLVHVSRKLFVPLSLALVAVHLFLGNGTIRSLVRFLQIPSESRNVAALEHFNKSLKQNELYLGVSDWRFAILGPLFLLVSIGVCTILNAFLHVSIVQLFKLVTRLTDPSKSRPPLPAAVRTRRSATRRLVVVAFIAGLVMFFVPFQFAFIAASIVQLGNTYRAYRDVAYLNDSADAATRRAKHNFAQFNHTLALIFIFTSIVNAPLLVVWVHNLANNAPFAFSTHHNVFSILPVLLIVENLAAGNMIPKLTRLQRLVSFGYIGYLVCYAVLYGTMHTYMLHHLVNILCGWLLVVYIDDPGTRTRLHLKQ